MDIIGLLLHFDQLIFSVVDIYGIYTYLIMFLVIFVETGLVIAPFFPGDTLLFAAGALAGLGKLNFGILFILLALAAILGDSLNYFIGSKFGNFLLKKNWISEEKVELTHKLYDKHGGKIIIFGRFLPIIRTFAPFVAGMSKMNYRKFFSYNVSGAIVWVLSFLILGYFGGNWAPIRENFTLVILFILVLFIPITWWLKYLVKKEKI